MTSMISKATTHISPQRGKEKRKGEPQLYLSIMILLTGNKSISGRGRDF